MGVTPATASPDGFVQRVLSRMCSNLTAVTTTICAHIQDKTYPFIAFWDRVKYASYAYVDELRGAEMQNSMARKGNPYDNAATESFMKTLKYEEVYLWDYRTVEDIRERIPYFLQEVYNQKRLHSALAYCPPSELEEQWEAKTKPYPTHSVLTLTT